MFSRKSESTSREATECENNLGKAPPVPPEANVMNISERIVDRISTGELSDIPLFASKSYESFLRSFTVNYVAM